MDNICIYLAMSLLDGSIILPVWMVKNFTDEDQSLRVVTQVFE